MDHVVLNVKGIGEAVALYQSFLASRWSAAITVSGFRGSSRIGPAGSGEKLGVRFFHYR
jgi:hypothetical protein